MSKSAHVMCGVVSGLRGHAKVVPHGKGAPQALKVGDKVNPGDIIVAAPHAHVTVRDAHGKNWAPLDNAHKAAAHHPGDEAPSGGSDLDRVISAVNQGEASAAPGAGLAGGGSTSLQEGTRVDRVIEIVTPQEFSVILAERGIASTLVQGGNALPDALVPTDPGLDPQPQPPANRPPVLNDPGNTNFKAATASYDYTAPENHTVQGVVKAVDPDGDALTYRTVTDPTHGTVSIQADGSWVYTPGKDYVGSDTFVVLVSDGHGGTTTASVHIGLTPVNEPPVVNDPGNGQFDPTTGNYHVTTKEDTAVSGQVKATDADGDTLTFVKGTDPAHGTVTVNADGTWTYTPGKDYNGSDSFTVSVSDGHGGMATSTVTVGIEPVNDAPKVNDPGNAQFDPDTGNYHVTTKEDTAVSGQVKATDADGDTLTFAKGTDPAHGTVTVNADGTWTYTPGKDYNGSDSFTVSVSDGHGGMATSTVTIGVQPVNDAPVVHITESGHDLLGLADVGVGSVLNLSKSQHLSVDDVDNNLVRVDISVDQLLSVGSLLGDHSALHLSMELATSLGLSVSGNDSHHLVIESNPPGHVVDIALVNQLLATVSYDPAQLLGLVSADLFPTLTLKATDAYGESDSQSVSSSVIAVKVDTPDPQPEPPKEHEPEPPKQPEHEHEHEDPKPEQPKEHEPESPKHPEHEHEDPKSEQPKEHEPESPKHPEHEHQDPKPEQPKEHEPESPKHPEHEHQDPKPEEHEPEPPKQPEHEHEDPKPEQPKEHEPESPKQPEHEHEGYEHEDPKPEQPKEHCEPKDDGPKTQHESHDGDKDIGSGTHTGPVSDNHCGTDSGHDQDGSASHHGTSADNQGVSLIEHLGSDVFAWALSEHPTSTGDDHGLILLSHNANPSEGAGMLDLRDLLHNDTPHAGEQGHPMVDDLLNFFSKEAPACAPAPVASHDGGADTATAPTHAEANASVGVTAGAEHGSGVTGNVTGSLDLHGSVSLSHPGGEHQLISELINQTKGLTDHHG